MTLPLKLSERLFKLVRPKAKSKAITNERHAWRGLKITTDQLHDDDIDLIQKVIEEDEGGKDENGNEHLPLMKDIANRRVLKSIKAYKTLKNQDSNTAKIKKLDLLPEAIRNVMRKTPNRWVYKADTSYGYMMPWFITNVVYKPPEKTSDNYIPASTTMHLVAFRRGEKIESKVYWHAHDLHGGGKTVHELFAEDQVMIETEEVNEEYRTDLEKYEKFSPQTGEQFLGTGEAKSDTRYHGHKVYLEVDGVRARLIMDSVDDEKDKVNQVRTHYWSGVTEEDVEESDQEDDDPNSFTMPVHPIVRLFHLERHEFIKCYSACIEPYVYDATLIDKLVLPAGNKELIDALTMSVVNKMDDVIAGKASGVMILCSGGPGIGKTLTAEVYSEAAQRPLYTVQCSQLGTDEEDIEKKLTTVLKRAVRWGAILLIDEADVYIHQRGSDIHQNAIVGVFLRTLEYFAGIMFLTTNRAGVTDDAIMSRMTAHIKYKKPQGDDRNAIWKILSTNFDVPMSDKMISEAVKKWPDFSGRTIRQTIRLSKFMADHRKKPVTIKTLEEASQFQDHEDDEE
jgi:hypothetical protein